MRYNKADLYRNFQDKYDLINWYFDKILLKSFEYMGKSETIYEGLVNKFLLYPAGESVFFVLPLKNDDQNCLRDHDFHLILQFYTDQIEQKTGEENFRAFAFLTGNVLPGFHLYDCTVGSWKVERNSRRNCTLSG